VKITPGIRPCGAFILHILGQIWIKISVFGVLHAYRCTDGGKIWHGAGALGPLLRAKFHPHRCNVSPLRGEKPQNRPLRAMLPVIKYDLYVKGEVPSKFEKSNECPPWMLLTEEEPFGDNDALVPWKIELKISGDGRQWNRQWFQYTSGTGKGSNDILNFVLYILFFFFVFCCLVLYLYLLLLHWAEKKNTMICRCFSECAGRSFLITGGGWRQTNVNMT